MNNKEETTDESIADTYSRCWQYNLTRNDREIVTGALANLIRYYLDDFDGWINKEDLEKVAELIELRDMFENK